DILLNEHDPPAGQEPAGQEPAGQEPAGQGGRWEVLADSAYGTGEALVALHDAGHTPIIKPWPLRPAVEGGFTSMTSPSSSPPMTSPDSRPAPTVSPGRSPRPATSPSARPVGAAHYGHGAPPTRPGGR